MRKSVAMPTLGMIIGFFAGLVIGYFWGIDFVTTACNLASDFFISLGIIVGTAFGIILLILLAIVFIKAWYFMVPFMIGLIGGILIGWFLGSAFFIGMTSSFRVIDDKGKVSKLFSRPILPLLRSVGS